MTLVNEYVDVGLIKNSDAEALNEMSTLTYEDILRKVLKRKKFLRSIGRNNEVY